jgi:tetratricopeptide (TPR) repeat protein
MFFILGRYRQPLVPLLTLFAATALVDVWHRVRTKDPTGIRAPIVAALIATVACNITVHEESLAHAASYVNVGLAAAQAGDIGTSIQVLSRAIQTHPEIAEAHLNLGLALARSNRPMEAIVCFRNALMLEPSLATADAMLGRSYERTGDRESALQHYQRAIQIDPTDDRSRQALGHLMQRAP